MKAVEGDQELSVAHGDVARHSCPSFGGFVLCFVSVILCGKSLEATWLEAGSVRGATA